MIKHILTVVIFALVYSTSYAQFSWSGYSTIQSRGRTFTRDGYSFSAAGAGGVSGVTMTAKVSFTGTALGSDVTNSSGSCSTGAANQIQTSTERFSTGSLDPCTYFCPPVYLSSYPGLWLGVDWVDKTSFVTVDITFSAPVDNPSFTLTDVNQRSGWADVVVVSATNCSGTTLFPSGVSPLASPYTYTAGTGTIAPTATTPAPGGNDLDAVATVNFASTPGVQTIRIVYKSNASIPGGTGNPSYEYIIVGAIGGTKSTLTTPQLTMGANQVINCNTSSVTISGSSSTSGVTYAWTGPSGGSTPTASSTVVSATGTYTLTVTSGLCQTNAGTVTVSSNTAAPNISVGSALTIGCSPTTATLSGNSSTAGATYAWTVAGTATAAGATPTSASSVVSAAGTYMLTVTNPSTGCKDSLSQAVTVNNTLPNISISPDQTINCITTTATLNGSSTTPGATYSWTGAASGAAAGTTPTASSTVVSAAGNYTLTVTNPANGCKDSLHESVSAINTLPNVTAGPYQTIDCSTPTATLTGNSTTPLATYAWADSTTGLPAGTTPTASSTVVAVAGTYILTVTHPTSGCTDTARVIVTSSPQVNVATIPGSSISCAANTITLSGSSTTPGATFAWTVSGTATPAGTTPASSSTNVTVAGTYTLTVTAGACSDSATVTVTGNSTPPQISIGPDKTINCNNPSALLVGSSTTSGATFAWTNASSNPAGTTPANDSTVVSVAGLYTLTVTDPANGCTSTLNESVTSNFTLPNVSVGPNQTLDCATTTVTLTGNSTTFGATFAWTDSTSGAPAGTTPASATTNVTLAGTYIFTVTHPSSQCTDTGIVIVTSSPQISVSAIPSNAITCSNPTVTLSGSSTTPLATFAWTGPTPGTPAGTTPGTSSTDVTVAGTYTLTVTTPGCSDSTTIVVINNSTLPNVSIGASQVISCSITTATLFGASTTPSATYAWTISNTATNAGTTPSNDSTDVTAVGTYTLTVTDPISGCKDSLQQTVTLNNTLPNVSVGANQILSCTTPTVTITGASTTIGAGFAWTDSTSGAPAGTTPGATSTIVNAVGTYVFTVTDPSSGCSDTAMVIVSTDNSLPQISVSSPLIINCLSPIATLTGSSTTSGVTLAWTDASSNPAGATPTAGSSDVTVPGTYTLTVTETATGCASNANVVVNIDTVKPQLTVNPSLNLNCTNSTVTLSASSTTAGVSFTWSIATLPAGTTPASDSTDVTAAGTYDIVIINPSNNCTNAGNVIVTIDTVTPQLTIGTNQTITCAVLLATLTGTSITGGVTYAWTDSTSGSAAGTTPTASSTNVATAGTYILTVTNPTSGCTNSDNVTVTGSSTLPQISIGSNQAITCLVDTVTLMGSSTTSGVTYTWSGPSGGTTPNNDSTNVTAAGTYTLTVSDPSNSCTSSQTVSVTVDTVVSAINITSTSGGVITCTSASVSLTASATGTNTYSWTGSTGPIAGNPINISAAGTYTVNVVNSTNGCVDSDSIVVTSNTSQPALASSSAASSLSCANLTTSLSSSSTSSNTSFAWTGPGGFTSALANVASVNAVGTYIVTVTDTLNGCTSSDTVIISQGVNPTVSFTPNVTTGTAPLSVTFTNTSTAGFNSYNWDLGNSTNATTLDAAATYNTTGTYTVVLIGNSLIAACNDTATIDIIVTEDDELIIPNVFSPNNDGTNELFSIKATGYTDVKMQIFDRWGLLMIELQGAKFGWDGVTTAGVACTDGTYFYLLTATRKKTGEAIKMQGYLTLVR